METSDGSNSSSPNIADDFANLMAQTTVIETDEMLLKHQRIVGKTDLPRKLATGGKISFSLFNSTFPDLNFFF
jgi:hypothetical protein